MSAREHFDMVDALEARDVKRLQKIIAAHVGQTFLSAAANRGFIP